ncbi:glutaminyl-peptide cyclotransferase [Microbulbifer marinus]|uniref:glutaminyl-peptide cyclotransferase n=1 Tax=Microbulbifer marinus TaxID=658218 RepID=UPI001FCE0091|nr:glutaminyl-peptide cyclotransferase [Microbulbifer marinus]
MAAAAETSLEAIPFTTLGERSRPADHFTQGLFFDGQRWWESSGLYRRSWLAEYTDPGANPLRRKWLAANRFAEGLTVLDGKVYLLTYKAGELQIYRAGDLTPLGVRHYAGEGWGLTSDGEQLIMSNGSDELTYRDPDTFAIKRRLKVHGGGEDWSNINELEYARGLIWANIWQDTRIIAIDPASGAVKGVIDLRELVPDSRHPDVVANGIAWDEARNGLWVTGKFWPKLYLIRPQGLGFENDGEPSD